MSKNTTSFDQYVGQRIRLARFNEDISQTQLGDALGVSFQQIQKYEKGTNRCSIASLVTIAKALKRPVMWFILGAPGVTAATTARVEYDHMATEILSTQAGRELVTSYNGIPSRDDKLAISQLASSLAHRNGVGQ